MPERQTLQACLARAARVGRPDRDGLIWLDRHEAETRTDWAEVQRRARRAGGALRARGLKPGERVALLLPTVPLFADAFFGVCAAGGVPVPLYPPVRLGRLDEWTEKTAAMLKAADVAAVVADARVRRVLGQVLARHNPRLGLISAEDLPAGPDQDLHRPDPDALAMVQFSSGTTVRPKPVGLSHRQVLANVERILDFMPEDGAQEHVGVSWLPLYHDMGLIGCVFVALHRPGPLVLIPPEAFLARPALWLRALSRYKGTVSPAPDFAYGLCVERVRDEELAGCDLSAWRLGLDGAEPVSPKVARAFAARFAPFGLRPTAVTPVYGLSEAALAVTFTDPDAVFPTWVLDREALTRGEARPVEPGQPGLELARVGRPLRDYAVKICEKGDDQPLPDGRVGRVLVRGPSLMMGYLDREEQPFVQGWLDTGDLGFLLQGELTITGRAKDLLVLRGRNHAPQDVEQALHGIDGVRTGCVAAAAQINEDGEQLLVFVEVRSRRPDLEADCRNAILASTGLRPDALLLLEPGTLPRTSSGKIRRGEALRQWQTGALRPPAPVTALRMAGALAQSAWGYLKVARDTEPDGAGG